MPVVVSCPACQTRYRIDGSLAGRKAKCKKCGQGFQIPQIPSTRTSSPADAPVAAVMTGGHAATRVAAATVVAPQRAPAPIPAESSEEEKRQCPHCAAWVASELQFCSNCRLNMRKDYGDGDSQSDRKTRKDWLYSLIGIGVSLLSAPIFFLVFAMVVGAGLAVFLSVLLMYIGISLGCFSLACQLFKQEPPEPMEILKIIFFSNLPANLLASTLFGGGLLGSIASIGLAIVFAALVCMLYAGIPVAPSIFISIAYNIFAGVLTFIWVLALMAVFAGYMVATQPAILN